LHLPLSTILIFDFWTVVTVWYFLFFILSSLQWRGALDMTLCDNDTEECDELQMWNTF
jgi:hypothetical protein